MDGETTAKHKFLVALELTFQEVFDFAYGSLIPVLQGLAQELRKDCCVEALNGLPTGPS